MVALNGALKRLCAASALAAGLLASLGALAQAPGSQEESVTRDVEYIPGGGIRTMLDVYVPKNAPKPLPTVLYLHGGGWTEGSKEGASYARELVKHGYAVVAANYRYSTQAPFPAQLEDCKAAVRWIRANAGSYGFDPERIGVTGDSAGGHLSALLATTGGSKTYDKGPNLGQRSDVQAALVLYGPENLVFQTMKKDFEKIGVGKDRAQWAFDCASKLLGADPSKNLAKAKDASPFFHISAKTAPIMAIHGKKDVVVPYTQSVDFVDALKKAGVEAKLILIENMGHSPAGECFENGRAEEALEFLDSHLKAKAPAKK